MERTKVTFNLQKFDELCIVGGNYHIEGWINWQLFNETFYDKSDDYLYHILDGYEEHLWYEVTIELWEDSDDYRTWYDYKVLSVEKE